MTRPRVRLLDLFRLVVVAGFFLMAPVAGDIGSCTEAADDLDPNKFFLEKQQVDCAACQQCGFETTPCKTACGKPMGGSFPALCYPTVHDGEVCLDALQVASCGDYASYVADQGATVPTECDFCPPRGDGGSN